ncbi:MAG TPA: Ig-like domain-containing protein, partial [Cytophagales bacterium]
GTARATPYGYSIFELEVYGTAPEAYCATAASGDYAYKAVTAGSNVNFTFHPLGAVAGGNLAIIYIREGAGTGAYPGYPMTKNDAGDFTFSKAIPAGTVLSIYFTYQVGPGGPERNSAATPHSYTVGTDCATTANAPPTVQITQPAHNATFPAPATLTLTATAADTDGTVSKVEFFNGATKLGEDTAAPYAFTWVNVAAGTYTLTAKATDNGGAATVSTAVTVTVTAPSADGYTLVWADEFTNGIGPDWVFETGRGSNGWGNNELQYYRQENASVQNGELVITAKKESFGGAAYTSARLKTQGKKAFRYGRMEAKIAMPAAQGLWPAFWMLGSSIVTEGWPSCGEIDIMEHVNASPDVHGTIHWSSDNGSYANYGGHTPANVTVAHVYSVEWDASAIRWFVDGVPYHEASIQGGVNGTDEFHEEFFLLLNMAVGGNWPGFNVDETALPANMYVDYVRVYQKPAPPYTGPTVRITAPANNATATPGATIAITASAGDAVNAITKVEFFDGPAKLGEDATAPYAFNWTGAALGTHTLTAKVTNNQGMSAVSAPVTVQVKDNVVAGDYFGIYTEQATITNRLAYGQDANLWIWNNLSNIAPAPAPFEGNEGLAFRAAPANWFGFGVDNELKNLGSYANGALKFHFKTTYQGQFKVGIKSGTNAESWIDFTPGLEGYGLRRDGQWHEVTIPFTAFNNLSLAALDQAFMFAGDAPTAPADFYFDNIYYTAIPPDADGDGALAPADCDDNNPAVYPGAPEKCDGLDNNCNGQVDEGIQMTAPVVTVTPSSNVYTGGNAKTIYLGYGPQSVTLTATNAPPAAAYAWSPATGLSNAKIANPVFTPARAGTYTFTVTGTNAAGCTANASVTITVIDARGTKNARKVLVCHKGAVQEVSAAEVPTHLNHGDKLGPCNPASGTTARTGSPAAEGMGTELVVYPNPAGARARITFTAGAAGAYRLALYDLNGRLVQEIAAGKTPV